MNDMDSDGTLNEKKLSSLLSLAIARQKQQRRQQEQQQIHNSVVYQR